MMRAGPRRFLSSFLAVALAASASPGLAAPASVPPGEAVGTWRLPFQLLGPDEGLAPGMVVSLAQDRDGFLWMATENGLVRYEGGHHRRWSVGDGLPTAYVARLLAAADGALWLVTARGLVRFRDGHFEPAHLGVEPVGTPASELVEDRSGRLWTATSGGLFVQRDGLGFAPLGWAPVRLLAMAAGARSGAVYVGHTGGLRAFLPGGAVRDYTIADGLPAGGPTLVVEDGAGRVWAGAGRALAVLEPGAASFQDRSRLLPASLTPNCTPFVEPDGSVWLPTQAGALRIAGERTELLDAAGGLPFRWVRAIYRDREGTLWVMGPALARLRGGGRLQTATLSRGASGEVVWFVTRDRAGRLLVATDDGVVRLGPSGSARIPGTEGRRIKGLAVDRGGTLWMVSTIGPSLWLLPGETRAEPVPASEAGASVNVVMEDSRGTVWFGHATRGLLRWDPPGRRMVEALGPGALQARALAVTSLAEDGAGRLWAGSDAGLLILDGAGGWRRFDGRDGLRPFGVRGVAPLPDGSAWLSYDEPIGLTRVRLGRDGLEVLEHRSRGPGLRSDQIYALRAGADGEVWVSTDQGFDRLDTAVHVGRHAGLASEDGSVNALLVEKGVVYVGTAGGLVRYADAGVEALAAAPRAFILEARLGSRRLEPPFGAVTPLAAGEATEFRVGAPAYAGERDLRFEVRLAGLEEAWREAEGPIVRYPALRGGTYRFEVRAAAEAARAGPVATFEFTVRPPWWRSWWAATLATLAAGLGMWGFVRVRLASLARSKAALEALVAARTAELQGRNEELTDALGKVRELSGLLPICMHCHKIRNDAGYWERIEKYISERSRAAFSHGLCPDCLRKYDDVR